MHSTTVAIYGSLRRERYSFPEHFWNFAKYPAPLLPRRASRVSERRADATRDSILSGTSRGRESPGERARRPRFASLRSLILNNFHLAAISQVGRKFTGGYHGARPTTDVASECFLAPPLSPFSSSAKRPPPPHSCSLQPAFSMGRK